MLFNSDQFLFLFLPIAFIGWLCVRRLSSRMPSMIWLIGCSLFFYSWWEPRLLPLLLVSIGFNYLLGQWLAGTSHPARRLLLVLGIAANIGALGYFKYADFFTSVVNDLLGTTLTEPHPVLPLAISFFTFQQVAFLVDAYRDEVKERGFLPYTLFVSFFPQLIAGPIVHHKEFLPQIGPDHKPRRLDRDLAVGLTIFAIGLFKKVVFADQIGAYVGPVFDAASPARCFWLMRPGSQQLLLHCRSTSIFPPTQTWPLAWGECLGSCSR